MSQHALEIPAHLTVRYQHRRRWKTFITNTMDGGVRHFINEKGGECVALLYDGDTLVARGSARCNPKESYNKRIGRAIALGRALKAYDPTAHEFPLEEG